jgi:hypothetical protein
MSIENYLTPTEAADFIGCSSARVRQMLCDGLLAGKKISPRLWLIPVEEAKKIRDLPAKTGRPRKSKNLT